MSDLPVIRTDRSGWRSWLDSNGSGSSGCWLVVNRGGGVVSGISYIDSVEEALCFGWIDSTIRRVGDEHLQRFTPRRDRNRWTQLNLARCRRLESMGLMTDAGRAAYPDDTGFSMDPEVVEAFFGDPVATEGILDMPLLYVMVRIGNIQIKRGTPLYVDRLERFLDDCRKGLVHGRWDDDGRLDHGPEFRFTRYADVLRRI